MTEERNIPAQKPLGPISLRPSSSDYATFVRTTTKAMNLSGKICRKIAPNAYVLQLTHSGSSSVLP